MGGCKIRGIKTVNNEKLILGHAGKEDSTAVTVDINPVLNPDVVHDLNKIPWPFKDSQFKQIICHHVLEHLEDLQGPMAELHRICSREGEIYIEVPYRTSWCADAPYHKLRFGWFALDPYLEGRGDRWLTNTKRFMVLEQKITFHKHFRRYLLHKLFNRFPFYYERFWSYIIPAEHLVFRLRPLKTL